MTELENELIELTEKYKGEKSHTFAALLTLSIHIEEDKMEFFTKMVMEYSMKRIKETQESIDKFESEQN